MVYKLPNSLDPIIRNDTKQGKFYIKILNQEVNKKQHDFDMMERELLITRHKYSKNKYFGPFDTNQDIVAAKREINEENCNIVKRITQGADTDFGTAVSEGKFIVDKTKFIPKLLKMYERQFIMLRPYRFGKTFFLSMLQDFFQGDKNLFCSSARQKMDICDLSYTWEKYPILSLNFAVLGRFSISEYILNQLHGLARIYGVECDKNLPNVDSVMQQTFKGIYNKMNKKVVVLVDEYDLPVMNGYFNDVAESKLNEKEIQGFFSALKSSSSFIHFAFIFGAFKVTTVGQTLNLLVDLTLNKEYSDLIGFTEEEIMKTYNKRLVEIIRERNLENIPMLFDTILRPYYNNYLFTRSGISVYNPVSITTFLVKNPENPEPYWAVKVDTRDFLQHTVKKFSTNTINILSGQNHTIKLFDTLSNKLNRDNIMLGDTTELAKVLFQMGHMTIKKSDNPLLYCDLGIVNEEAKYIFERCLQQKMMNEGPLEEMENMLQQYKFEEFIKVLEDAMIHLIGNEYYNLEAKYEVIFGILLELRGQTYMDYISAIKTSTRMKQFVIETKKYADYVKIMPFSKMTIIFYLKKYEPKERPYNTTFELMKCHSAYVKVYAEKNKTDEIVCIVVIFYTGEGQAKRVKNLRIRDENRQYIMDWAALEWFREVREIQEHNIHPALSDEQRDEIAEYSDMDQKKRKQVFLDSEEEEEIQGSERQEYKQVPEKLVPEKLIPAAHIFKNKTPLSLNQFTKLIERCKYPTKDGVRIVKEFTNDTEGVIQLIDECYAYVHDRWLRLRLTKIKKALQN